MKVKKNKKINFFLIFIDTNDSVSHFSKARGRNQPHVPGTDDRDLHQAPFFVVREIALRVRPKRADWRARGVPATFLYHSKACAPACPPPRMSTEAQGGVLDAFVAGGHAIARSLTS